MTDPGVPFALVGGRILTDLDHVTSDLGALDTDGQWAVAISFEGQVVCARFQNARAVTAAEHAAVLRSYVRGSWQGIDPDAWTSSLGAVEFTDRVREIRSAIASGDVYQVNLTRRLSAPLAAPDSADPIALAVRLARLHPAPFAATISLPGHGIQIVSASPERFLERHGMQLRSSPIKGTAAHVEGLTDKDRAENVMIVDLVRNDLGRVCEFGSVSTGPLLDVERHPGLVHLVSHVEGTLRPDVRWADIIAATFPPGSVTGAPKVAALAMIERLEPVHRHIYCGALGWVDADRRDAVLNVAIRTFWIDGDRIHLGTGGGITWGSTPEDEWSETELKAARLIETAAGNEGGQP